MSINFQYDNSATVKHGSTEYTISSEGKIFEGVGLTGKEVTGEARGPIVKAYSDGILEFAKKAPDAKVEIKDRSAQIASLEKQVEALKTKGFTEALEKPTRLLADAKEITGLVNKAAQLTEEKGTPAYKKAVSAIQQELHDTLCASPDAVNLMEGKAYKDLLSVDSPIKYKEVQARVTATQKAIKDIEALKPEDKAGLRKLVLKNKFSDLEGGLDAIANKEEEAETIGGAAKFSSSAVKEAITAAKGETVKVLEDAEELIKAVEKKPSSSAIRKYDQFAKAHADFSVQIADHLGKDRIETLKGIKGFETQASSLAKSSATTTAEKPKSGGFFSKTAQVLLGHNDAKLEELEKAKGSALTLFEKANKLKVGAAVAAAVGGYMLSGRSEEKEQEPRPVVGKFTGQLAAAANDPQLAAANGR